MSPECILFKQVRPIRHTAASVAVLSAGPGADVEDLPCFSRRQGSGFASVARSRGPKRKELLVTVDALPFGAFKARGTKLRGACTLA